MTWTDRKHSVLRERAQAVIPTGMHGDASVMLRSDDDAQAFDREVAQPWDVNTI